MAVRWGVNCPCRRRKWFQLVRRRLQRRVQRQSLRQTHQYQRRLESARPRHPRPRRYQSSPSPTLGQRNFIVNGLHGGHRDTFVNVIGAYQGSRPLAGTDPGTVDIQADGAWGIQIAAIASGGTPSFSGKGESVSALFDPPASGPWQIMHDGRRNFIVELHCTGGDRSLQNEIGPVNGSRVVVFLQDPCFWEVIADGAWSLQPR